MLSLKKHLLNVGYSTIRRVLLNVDYQAYSACLASFFEVQPKAGEMIAP